MRQRTLEERVAYLEGKAEECSRGHAEIRQDIGQLRSTVQQLDQRLDAWINVREQKADRSREKPAGRICAADDWLLARFDALDEKLSWWFSWFTALLVTTLLVQTVLLAAALFRR